MTVETKTSSYWGFAESCWKQSCEPGELQNRIQALTRTFVGIASIALYPSSAVAGAVAGVVKPDFTHAVNDKADAMITALWNSLSYKQKMAASVAGITLASYGASGYLPGFMHIPGAILAAKLAAELVYKNSIKQEMAAEIKKIEQKYMNLSAN